MHGYNSIDIDTGIVKQLLLECSYFSTFCTKKFKAVNHFFEDVLPTLMEEYGHPEYPINKFINHHVCSIENYVV